MNKLDKVFCPACKGIDIDIIRPYRNIHAIYAGMHLAKCRSCTLVFSTPMPSDDGLEEYNSSYFDSAHGGLQQSPVALAFFKGIANIRALHLKKFLIKNKIKAERILEIGPGHGFFAENWMKSTPGTKYYGAETDTSCHHSLKQLGVELVQTGESLPATDVVVLSHVLEHISRPSEFLSEVTKNLRPGGVLFIEVPCQDWKHKSVDEPHLLFFEKHSMSSLLKNLNFSGIEVSYHGREIDSLQNESTFTKKLSSIRTKLMNMGIVAPFVKYEAGLDEVLSPLEMASINPFKPHIESVNPSWWLRALAIKNS